MAPRPAGARIRRVNEAVKEVVAERLVDLKDPRIGFVTLTDVRTAADLRHAKVYFTVLPDTPESRDATIEGLRSATPVLRRELGARLRMRHVPDLEFVQDPVADQGRRIETLLADDRARDADGDR